MGASREGCTSEYWRVNGRVLTTAVGCTRARQGPFTHQASPPDHLRDHLGQDARTTRLPFQFRSLHTSPSADFRFFDEVRLPLQQCGNTVARTACAVDLLTGQSPNLLVPYPCRPPQLHPGLPVGLPGACSVGVPRPAVSGSIRGCEVSPPCTRWPAPLSCTHCRPMGLLFCSTGAGLQVCVSYIDVPLFCRHSRGPPHPTATLFAFSGPRSTFIVSRPTFIPPWLSRSSPTAYRLRAHLVM